MKKLISLLLLTSYLAFAGNFEAYLQAVPNTSTSVTTRVTYVQLIWCAVGTSTALTITDTAGTAFINAAVLPANTSTLVYSGSGNNGSANGLKMNGIKWSATVATNCQIQGYQP